MDLIPPWLPPVFCLLCSVVSGLTSFGDAILFQVLWAVAGAMDVVPTTRASLTVATLITALQGLSNLPVMLVQSRRQLAASLPYGIVMGVAGAAAVPLGTELLYAGDLSGVKTAVGLVFVAFSTVKLSFAAAAVGRKRAERAAGGGRGLAAQASEAPAPEGHGSRPAVTDRARTDAAGEAGRPSEIAGTGAASLCPPGRADVRAATTTAEGSATKPAPAPETIEPPAWVPVRLRPYLTLRRISPVASAAATFGGLAGAGVGAGLLGAMYGTGGPPQMVAFATLQVEKDFIRSVSAVYSVIELTSRFTSYAQQKNTPLSAAAAPLYVSIPLCSWAGFSTGSYLRRYTDTDVIIRMLLALVYASSAILLGALDNSAVTAGFCVFTSAWLVFLTLLVLRPRWAGFSLFPTGIR